MLTTNNNLVMLSDKVYSIGKKLVQIYIPALSTLYFGLSGIWGLPYTEQIIGTLAALATFIGAVLIISSNRYDVSGAAHDGQILIETSDVGDKTFILHLDGDPLELENKTSVAFKVIPEKQ